MAELYHHGIKGMRWGVRRYQNYDGSYTKKGLERYNKAESEYNKAKATADQTKAAYKSGTATKAQYKQSKGELKAKKRELSTAYDNLKTDNMADEGKKLYRSGKTITGNTSTTQMAEAGIILGSAVANKIISSTTGNKAAADIVTAAIAIGGTVANTILYGKMLSDNDKLRAYYGH